MTIDTWRLPERAEVVAATGTLQARAAQPTGDQVAGRSNYLRDDGRILPLDIPDADLGHGVRLARSATGGLSIRSGNLREILAAADTDALLKLRAAENEHRG